MCEKFEGRELEHDTQRIIYRLPPHRAHIRVHYGPSLYSCGSESDLVRKNLFMKGDAPNNLSSLQIRHCQIETHKDPVLPETRADAAYRRDRTAAWNEIKAIYTACYQ
ncbi:hypothetical protein LX76_04632 [Cereibacter changlensis]|uniref:Uncharacterized protein n=1 Tax=Cereibacter changlensis TaxID=402884 RepID=A0A2W7QEB0_9RHOB|nr:hypothetical protein [Cereibacter changlensis]PZX46541.1 hypothetical protein LX76_04632 [Cereibacter changlensis]